MRIADMAVVAASIAACTKRNVSEINPSVFFSDLARNVAGVSLSEASWQFHSGALLVSQAKTNLPSSMLQPLDLGLFYGGLPQQ